jgi:tetratricopeptide (TPR) repeat protein
MKYLFLSIFFIVVCIICNGQITHIKAEEGIGKVSFACNFFDQNTQYNSPPAKNISDAESEKWMKEMVDKITALVGLKNRFRLRSVKNYNNCAAVCFDNNIGQERFIQFDRIFLEEYQRKTKNKWFVVGVLAHELGHHLNGHSLDGIGSRPDKELDADEFAGFVLQKLGANYEEARAIFSFLNETEGPPTHPVRWKRYTAVSRGWDRAAGNEVFAKLYVLDDAERKANAYAVLTASRKEFSSFKKLLMLDNALKLVPDYAEAISEKGLVYLEMQKYTEAYEFCRNALKLEPYIGLLRFNLSKVYYQQKIYDSALAYIQDAIYLKPVFPEAYLFRANIFFDNKVFEQTVSDCNLAFAMNPANNFYRAEILETKGFALYELNKKTEADECFEEARKLNPLSIRVLQYFELKNKK